MAGREVVVSRQSGAALVMALVALTVVLGVVLVVASQLQGLQAGARHDARSAVLASLADAAFAEALARLSEDPGFTGAPARRFGAGEIASAVGVSEDGARAVTATASYQGWTEIIVAEVDLTAGPRILRLTRSQPPRSVSR